MPSRELQRTPSAGLRRISSRQRIRLDTGWRMIAVEPGAATRPGDLPETAWNPALSAAVPGTVAATLRDTGALPSHGSPDLDARDYWYRSTFSTPDHQGPIRLEFQGLATLAEVWLNGTRILTSDNMFLGRSVDITDTLAAIEDAGAGNILHLRFASLTRALEQPHPRARWRTKLVFHRHLRFYRTTLLGRMPALPPHWAPVGPWRPVDLVMDTGIRIDKVDLRPGVESGAGVVRVAIRVSAADCRGNGVITQGILQIGAVMVPLDRRETPSDVEFSGELRIPDPVLWWPHTHGKPHLYPAELRLMAGGDEPVIVELVPIGFRTLQLNRGNGEDFRVILNGVPLYCRGVCWMPPDPYALDASPEELRRTLEELRDAGVNMVRISAVTVYESDAFYALCAELGILVWQDFMFASMDYPTNDEAFCRSIEAEIRYQLERLGHLACLAVLCGNSEVFQQPAMLGLPANTWHSEWYEGLPETLCRQARPDVIYVPGSPSGGALPFHTNSGVSHYFGVGAYRRPLEDARLGEPRFASECLALSNPPEPETLTVMAEPATRIMTSASFHAGTPRDAGADWDFMNVTEHYARLLFGDDVTRLKEDNPVLYLDICRAAVGEVMAQVQRQWRRSGAGCAGGLIWTSRDLSPGPGWGIVDCRGVPKSAYYYLKRVWTSPALLVLDEGLNGLHLHLVNDRESRLEGSLELLLMRFDGITVASARQNVTLPARNVIGIPVDAMLGGFLDSSYAYRFGPPAFDVLWAGLTVEQGACGSEPVVAAETVHLPRHTGLLPARELDLLATVRERFENACTLEISTRYFAQAVSIHLPGYRPSDNYFHLIPGRPKRIQATRWRETAHGAGVLRALNARSSVPIELSVDATEGPIS